MPHIDGDAPKYDNHYSPEGLYGHVVDLLGQHPGSETAPVVAGVHLDIACGYAAIGEIVEAQFGLTYVGVDVDSVAVDAVRGRGLEAHAADLGGSAAEVLAALDAVLHGRRVASVTVLDGVEHFADAKPLLLAIRSILLRDAAVLVVSIPNVTHRDVGYKLALGSWGYTRSGLLDSTHVRLFSETELNVLLANTGLHAFARNDLALSRSDQHFPEGHPALQPGTTLNYFLNGIRDQAEPNGRINQFVWACLPGPVSSAEFQKPAPESEFFLSVVMRTKGNRIPEMTEALLCLAAQSNQDFELLVVGHHLDREARHEVEKLIAGMPKSLQDRTRIILVDHGSRATPLNEAFSLARGRYVAAFDDDDLLFAHWVEVFAALERDHPGNIFRSVCVRQNGDRVALLGGIATRAADGCSMDYAREFSFISHLSDNHSPFMTLAFPRALFRDLGLRFDESLTTAEDWDYLLRAASLVDVVESKEITAIYRKWESLASSSTVHHQDEWTLNRYSVHRKIDNSAILLPRGETRKIRELFAAAREPKAASSQEQADRQALQYRLLTLLESRSWRATAGLRAVLKLVTRAKSMSAAETIISSTPEIQMAITAIEQSNSWRLTSVLRRGR